MGTCCIINFNFIFDYNCNLLSCGRFDLESGHAADCASAAAHRTKDSGNELVLTAAHYKTENLPLNQRRQQQWQPQWQPQWQQQEQLWQRTQIALIATNFSYSRIHLSRSSVCSWGQRGEQPQHTWRGDCRESTIVRRSQAPATRNMPNSRELPAPHPPLPYHRHDEQRFGHACWAFLRIQLQIRLQLVLVLHSGLDRTGSNANSTLQHGLSN